MRYSVVNLGCKVNRVESDAYEALFSEHGFSSVAEAADVVVVNTCTVTGEADKKTRKAVRQALKRNPAARVVVTGCAAAINACVFEEMSERVEVVSKPEALLRLARVCEETAGGSVPANAGEAAVLVAAAGGDAAGGGAALNAVHGNAAADGLAAPPFSERARTRVGVKVQDGCDNACTYCIVHVARGKAVSVPLESVREEVAALARSGVREIVLSGINIGSYDFEGARLEHLLEELLAATEGLCAPGETPVRFRVSSVEPMDVSDGFVRLMARASGRVCRHLHLPLQSGSSKVLREMARPYDAQDYQRLVDFTRAEVPELSLSTDIIVGFPGETEEDFEDTLALARSCGFSKIHVFPYSMRAGTPAAERADQVPPELKAERARRLRLLSDELREADYRVRRGSAELVLVELAGRAMTESYYEVPVPEGWKRGTLRELVLPDAPCDFGLPEA